MLRIVLYCSVQEELEENGAWNSKEISKNEVLRNKSVQEASIKYHTSHYKFCGKVVVALPEKNNTVFFIIYLISFVPCAMVAECKCFPNIYSYVAKTVILVKYKTFFNSWVTGWGQ